jgi:hypothetical protein
MLPRLTLELVRIAVFVDPRFPNIFMEPEVYLISKEILFNEFCSIYIGLAMVESKYKYINLV